MTKPDVSNPFLMNEYAKYVPLDAFNLTEGAAFLVLEEPDPRVWVVVNLVRDIDHEKVHVWARNASQAVDGGLEFKFLTQERAFVLDFCDQIALVGIVANPDDPDDCNWGQ